MTSMFCLRDFDHYRHHDDHNGFCQNCHCDSWLDLHNAEQQRHQYHGHQVIIMTIIIMTIIIMTIIIDDAS